MTGQSRSAQEVQITLRSEQGATRPATATLTQPWRRLEASEAERLNSMFFLSRKVPGDQANLHC